MHPSKPEFKLLIVDDMPQYIKMLDHCLRSDYQVFYAASGKEAVEIAFNEKMDLILLDIMMPEMDGYETCQILKKNTNTQDIPIIFLTARTHEKDILQGFKSGAVDYIVKPFNAAELLARVKIHLELKKAKKVIEKQAEELTWTNKRLKKKNQKLQQAIDEIETLKGLLPVCSSCKKIRVNNHTTHLDTWVSLEAYLHEHTAVEVTHSICPECMVALYPDLLEPEDAED